MQSSRQYVSRIRAETKRIREAVESIDNQTVVVLLVAALLVILQSNFGSRSVFRSNFSEYFDPQWRGLFSWGWWFVVQGVLGFVVPVALLRFWKGLSLQEMGLGLGDWKLASVLGAAYLPLVVIGTFFLSSQDSFQSSYPHYQPAALNWKFFLVYELLFLFYWVGWEYLWRGFILFGTAKALGYYAIFVQAMPFAILHMQKPLPEGILSIVGGVALGALVWRCRSFWIAVPIHALQMLALDLWCSLRIRTDVSGIGFADLAALLRELF
ncbi:MAG: CPBP family intramembrane metalloprotease [Rhodothermales bacterium]|nr:CPBP family intramembrane metalloprotease [Rhodothermales bacterium]